MTWVAFIIVACLLVLQLHTMLTPANCQTDCFTRMHVCMHALGS